MFKKRTIHTYFNRFTIKFNFSRNQLIFQVKLMIDFYNTEVERFKEIIKQISNAKIETVVFQDPKKLREIRTVVFTVQVIIIRLNVDVFGKIDNE